MSSFAFTAELPVLLVGPVVVEPVGRTDDERFAAVVREHQGGLARLAYAMCGDRQRAEDAVAEAYARVWPKFRDGKVDDLTPYLRRAVVNQVQGGFRRRFLERREEHRRTVDWRQGPGHDERLGEQDRVWRALLQLPVDQRAVLVLRFFEDLSEQDTAALLGLKQGTVKSRSSRALDRLRQVLAEDEDHDRG